MRAAATMPGTTETPPVPWTLWGLSPIELHDRLWLRRGVVVVRPGDTRPRESGVRRYLAVPESHHLALAIPGRRAGRGTHRVRTIGASRTSYQEYLDFDEERSIRSIRREYSPNENARPDCVVTGDGRLARRLSINTDAIESLNGAAPYTSETPGIILFDARDADECARWLGALIEQGDDPATIAPGVRRFGNTAWGVTGADLPASVRLAGPVFLGRGVRLPDDCVVVGPAVLPDGWTDEDPFALGLDTPPRTDTRHSKKRTPVYDRTKRAFDVIAAAVLLIALAPMMAAIAVAIRLQDGTPVLFRQARQTHGGSHFECLKFRTMIRNADALQDQLREQNQVDGPQFAMKHDPRILPIGRWLRKTQLDELPQLWNVIRGEMSLVGPRPSPEYENQCCPPWREARLSVPAGITGLWQVRRRREPDTDFQEWIRYDIEYAARRGWWLDCCILCETAWLFVPYRARIGRAVLRTCRRIAGRRTRGTRPI